MKLVGSTAINLKHKASCHCGAVVLELDLPDGFVPTNDGVNHPADRVKPAPSHD